jgi:hypothetical protein
MPEPKPQRLDQVLTAPTGRLGAITSHARRLAELDALIRLCLGDELAAHCRLADLRSGRLVLAADTPAWATRLRYHTPEIRQKLAAAGLTVAECRVVVAPPPPARDPGPMQRPDMSADSAGTLHATADSIRDPALAAALRRLARNGEG